MPVELLVRGFHGQGKGFMKTKDGAVINLVGSGVGKAVGDGFE